MAVNYFILRRYGDCERTFDRIINLEPDQSLLKLEKAVLLVTAKADLTNFQAALDGVPASMKDNQIVARWRFDYAVLARDWTRAKGVLSNSSNEEFPFSRVDALVPRGCLQIWLARVQGDHPRMEGDFAAAHDQLTRKVDSRPENGALLSALGLIDAALGRKQEAISESKRAAEMLPISADALNGPSFVYNLAAVYALTKEANLAFDQLAILVKTPGGVGYGQLKLDPAWDPLRKDPRFDKLLAELAPGE